jgi:hypothetical protein
MKQQTLPVLITLGKWLSAALLYLASFAIVIMSVVVYFVPAASAMGNGVNYMSGGGMFDLLLGAALFVMAFIYALLATRLLQSSIQQDLSL